MTHSKFGAPKHPIREVLQGMTGVRPPAFVKGYSFNGLTDAETQELQNWCVAHVRPSWLTGIGLMDAAEAQVQEAVSNGNIPEDKSEAAAELNPTGVLRCATCPCGVPLDQPCLTCFPDGDDPCQKGTGNVND